MFWQRKTLQWSRNQNGDLTAKYGGENFRIITDWGCDWVREPIHQDRYEYEDPTHGRCEAETEEEAVQACETHLWAEEWLPKYYRQVKALWVDDAGWSFSPIEQALNQCRRPLTKLSVLGDASLKAGEWINGRDEEITRLMEKDD